MSGGFDSGEESSAYSYKDFAVYQYSDVEDDSDFQDNPNRASNTVVSLEDEGASFNDWNDYDDESYVMHVQSDDEFERYQFSEEDLIPEEPDEEWIVAALMANRRDFDHLELILEEMEDFPRFIQAIEMNRVVTSVTIFETFYDGLPTVEEKRILAETICNMRQLEQLKVYFHSSYFVKPLDTMRPPKLKHLCLMFFPEQPDKTSLASLTRILKGGHGEDEADNNDRETEQEDTTATEPLASLPLESLSLRCDVMDDEFIQAIASGMSANPTLTTLSFWGNNVHVTDKGSANSAKIDFFLRLNQRGIRDMHLLVNATPVEFLDKVVEERESIDLVFYLLQTNPSFLSYSTV